jgi:hypothetical protein
MADLLIVPARIEVRAATVTTRKMGRRRAVIIRGFAKAPFGSGE